MSVSTSYAIAKLKSRMDANVKCKGSNKPCGDRCIPAKQTCQKDKETDGKPKSKGNIAGAAVGVGFLGAIAGHDIQLTSRINDYNEKVKNGGKSAKEKEKDDLEEAYATLGVKKGATPDEIKSAYKAAARKYHPDVNKDPKAAEKFANINAAMDRLDPRKQAAAKDVKAEKRKGRGDSLAIRLDAFVFSRIQDAYEAIQQDFPKVKPDFWRVDAAPKCKGSNKPCGDRCIPSTQTCKKDNKDGKGKSSTLKNIAILGAAGLGGAALGKMAGDETARSVIAEHEMRQKYSQSNYRQTQRPKDEYSSGRDDFKRQTEDFRKKQEDFRRKWGSGVS